MNNINWIRLPRTLTGSIDRPKRAALPLQWDQRDVRLTRRAGGRGSRAKAKLKTEIPGNKLKGKHWNQGSVSALFHLIYNNLYKAYRNLY